MDDSALAIFCGSRAAAGSLISSLIFFCCARMGSWAAPPFWLVGCCRASPRLWFAPAHRTRWRTRWACRRPNPPTNLQRFSWSWRIRCHQIDPQILVELAGYTVWDLQQKLWICHGFQMGKITLLIAHPPLISGLGFKEKGEFGI